MNPNLRSQMNEIILDLDEFVNTHARWGIHRLDLCISNENVVKPLHKIIFQKPFIVNLVDLLYLWNKNLILLIYNAPKKIFSWLYDIVNFVNLILEVCLNQKSYFIWKLWINLLVGLVFAKFWILELLFIFLNY